MYVKKVTSFRGGEFQLIKKYHTARMNKPVPKGEQRQKKQKPTSDQQALINERKRTENLRGLLLENFNAGDCYLTFTYRDKPGEPEKIKQDVRNLLRKLKYKFRRNSLEWKYIGIIENIAGGGRPHYHLLLPKLPDTMLAEIRTLWPQGNIKAEFYGGELEDAERLASYFCKESRFQKCGGRIQTSRTLKHPVEKKEIVKKAKTFDDKLKAPKGYTLVKDLSYTGTTIEGYSYVQVFCRREEKDSGGKKRRIRKGL